MPKPAPKGALRKAPSGPHPIAPPSVRPAEPIVPQVAGTDEADAALPASTPGVTTEQELTGVQISSSEVGADQAGAEPSSAGPGSAVRASSLPMFSVRMDPALRRQVKRWAAEHEVSLQALTAAALHEYMERHDS